MFPLRSTLRSTLRRNTSLICVFCRQTRAASKFGYHDKSPRTRHLEKPGGTIGPMRITRKKTWRDSLFSSDRIEQMYNAKTLKTDPTAIYLALLDFGDQMEKRAEPDVIQVFHRYGVCLGDLVHIASGLLHYPGTVTLGSLLLRSASKAGVAEATVRLVKSAFLREMSLDSASLAGPMKQFRILVSSKNISAMVLMAQIKYVQDDPQGAVDLLTEAVEMQKADSKPGTGLLRDPRTGDITETVPNSLMIDDSQGSFAWQLLGKIWNEHGNIKKATEAYNIGAKEYGDPRSYWQLAEMEPGFTVEWLEYVTKAAAVGHGEAAFELARFYHMEPEHLKAMNENCLISFRKDYERDDVEERIEKAKLNHQKAEKVREQISELPKVPFLAHFDPCDTDNNNHETHVEPRLSLAAEWYYVSQFMEIEEADEQLRVLSRKAGIDDHLQHNYRKVVASRWKRRLDALFANKFNLNRTSTFSLVTLFLFVFFLWWEGENIRREKRGNDDTSPRHPH